MFIHRQRMEARTAITVQATLRSGHRDAEAVLVNASSRGVLAVVDEPPARGTLIELEIGGAVLTGQVRWRASDRCGIALRRPIRVADLVVGRVVHEPQASERVSRRRPLDIFRSMLG